MPGDDRPRNIMIGSWQKHGASTYLQGPIHEGLRRHCPGYIQAMSKEQLTTLLADKVDQTWKSYSMDGSAFEST
jgi:hypothetical protein